MNLERTLEHLNLALEESPAPGFEWNGLVQVLVWSFCRDYPAFRRQASGGIKAAPRATPDDDRRTRELRRLRQGGATVAKQRGIGLAIANRVIASGLRACVPYNLDARH